VDSHLCSGAGSSTPKGEEDSSASNGGNGLSGCGGDGRKAIEGDTVLSDGNVSASHVENGFFTDHNDVIAGMLGHEGHRFSRCS